MRTIMVTVRADDLRECLQDAGDSLAERGLDERPPYVTRLEAALIEAQDG